MLVPEPTSKGLPISQEPSVIRGDWNGATEAPTVRRLVEATCDAPAAAATAAAAAPPLRSIHVPDGLHPPLLLPPVCVQEEEMSKEDVEGTAPTGAISA